MRTLVVVGITLTLMTSGGRAAAQEIPPQPVQVVASLLELSEPQVASWLEILAERETAVQPLAQQLQERHQALGEALQNSSPDPRVVGQLIIDIRAIERSIVAIRQEGNASFEQLLTETQRQRLQQIRGASQVCPVVPALQATGLL